MSFFHSGQTKLRLGSSILIKALSELSISYRLHCYIGDLCFLYSYYSKMLNAYIIKTLEFLLVVWKVFLTNRSEKVTDFQDFWGWNKGKNIDKISHLMIPSSKTCESAQTAHII